MFFFFHRFFAAIRRKKAKAKDAPQREGYELEVSIPRVIIKTVGGIMETLGNRGAQLLDMIDSNDVSRLTYIAPSRGLLAFARHIKTS